MIELFSTDNSRKKDSYDCSICVTSRRFNYGVMINIKLPGSLCLDGNFHFVRCLLPWDSQGRSQDGDAKGFIFICNQGHC